MDTYDYKSDYESVLAQSVAPSTKTQYDRSWKTFQTFCEARKMIPLECDAEGILSYLSYLRNKHSGGISTAQTHMSAIAYQYRLHGRNSISEDPRISMYMKGLKRLNNDKPVTRAKPMTIEVLQAMRRVLYTSAPNLVTWRTVWRAHIEFFLMLRWDDVSRLKVSDLKLETSANGRFYRVSLQGGKAQMSSNHSKERIITENVDAPAQCLVKLTEDYLRFLGAHAGSLQPNCSPGNPKIPHPSRTVGYSLALDDLRRVINMAGFNGNEYSEHSNKRGGATHAAAIGMTDEEITDVGNWASTKVAKKYIQNSTPIRINKLKKFQTKNGLPVLEI